MTYARTLLIIFLVTAPALARDPALQALAENGHYRRLYAAVEPRLRANQNDAEAAYFMSRVKAAFDDLDAALQLAEKAVQLDGRNADYHYQLSEVLGSMAERAGKLSQISLGRRCKKELDAALALDPRHLDSMETLLGFYWMAPAILGGSKDKARATAQQMTAIDPARGYLAQLTVARWEKNTAAEGPLCQKAVEADPRNYRARVQLAVSYATAQPKRFDLAEQQAREALKLRPEAAGAYGLLAQLLAAQEKWAELDATLAAAEKAVPENLLPYYQTGNTLLNRAKDLPRAERYFRKYLAQDPEGGAPPLAAAHWRLGLVLEKEGNKPQAVTEIAQAVRMKPDLEAARKDLKRLQ